MCCREKEQPTQLLSEILDFGAEPCQSSLYTISRSAKNSNNVRSMCNMSCQCARLMSQVVEVDKLRKLDKNCTKLNFHTIMCFNEICKQKSYMQIISEKLLTSFRTLHYVMSRRDN